MIISKKEELEQGNLFSEVNELLGASTMEELERDSDEYIFYADGTPNSVVWHIKEESYLKPFHCYYFDGWYIALINI
ncbi:hypothetical protein LMOIWNZ_00070 [Enterococcus phage vB_OCPT_CCS3]|nr:hypothetical protein LMOIWNZ_00070 [Enterococcus phage vB_OCPT_CCS3]